MSHTHKPPRELDEIETESVSRKALAAGFFAVVTVARVTMIGELSQ